MTREITFLVSYRHTVLVGNQDEDDAVEAAHEMVRAQVPERAQKVDLDFYDSAEVVEEAP